MGTLNISYGYTKILIFYLRQDGYMIESIKDFGSGGGSGTYAAYRKK